MVDLHDVRGQLNGGICIVVAHIGMTSFTFVSKRRGEVAVRQRGCDVYVKRVELSLAR